MITTTNQEGKFPLTQVVNSVYPVTNTDNEQLAIYYVYLKSIYLKNIYPLYNLFNGW